MTQPLGNCPGCGGDEPFEQVHNETCPDAAVPGSGGPGTDCQCPEWACTGCGAAVIMGIPVPAAGLLASRTAHAA